MYKHILTQTLKDYQKMYFLLGILSPFISLKMMKKWCDKKKMDVGMCHYITIKQGDTQLWSAFSAIFAPYCTYRGAWICNYPFTCKDKKELLFSFSQRINVLKECLKS